MTKRDDIHKILDVYEEWETDHDVAIELVLVFDLAERLQILVEQAREEGTAEAFESGKRIGKLQEQERCAEIAETAYRTQSDLPKHPAWIVIGNAIARAIRDQEATDGQRGDIEKDT